MCVSSQVIHLQRAELNREMVYPMHPTSIDGVADMSTLAELHEAAIMHNLFLRYKRDNIYVSYHTMFICEHGYRAALTMRPACVGPLCCPGVCWS